INECENENPCKHGTCKNIPGNYTCQCPFGYHGDGKVGCTINTAIKVMIGIGTFIFLVVLVLFLHCMYKRKIQEINLRNNGGSILENLSTIKTFKETQLEKATNNFDKRQLLGEGGNGSVYKGSIDNMIDIAVKKSKVVDQNQIGQFLNEADVVSKINHNNVVKLLGVCCESKVPMLVYEFVPNGTLSHHIHASSSSILSSWSICLRIVTETARALDYMHSDANPPIIHRDVKPSNILLDGTYTAKVSDFGASKLIPKDRTMAPTQGQGTMGYLDPEYVQTGELTTLSDVYGFGVVLMELLAKQKPLTLKKPGEMISLVKVFTSAIENNQLDQILKVPVAIEHETEDVQIVAKLAVRCVSMQSKDRPTMREVADVLNGLFKKYCTSHVEGSCDEQVNLKSKLAARCVPMPSEDDQDVTSTSFELEYSSPV
ncbi:Wall-associated receptor kinase, partial [Thalictrum thalictroides]